jgi:hypothetical protein
MNLRKLTVEEETKLIETCCNMENRDVNIMSACISF